MNGNQVDSRIWKIAIFDYEKEIKFVFDTGSVMFWVVIIILLIIIGLIIGLLIGERKKIKSVSRFNPKEDPVLDLTPAKKSG